MNTIPFQNCHSERSEAESDETPSSAKSLAGTADSSLREAGTQTLRSAQGDSMGRRAFFRALWLAGTSGLAWMLLRRSCVGKGACGGCVRFGNCGLPWKEPRP